MRSKDFQDSASAVHTQNHGLHRMARSVLCEPADAAAETVACTLRSLCSYHQAIQNSDAAF